MIFDYVYELYLVTILGATMNIIGRAYMIISKVGGSSFWSFIALAFSTTLILKLEMTMFVIHHKCLIRRDNS